MDGFAAPGWLARANVWLLGILLSLGRIHLSGAASRDIRIGGLFERDYGGQELVFKYAIEQINRDRDLLPNIKLVYDIQETPEQDSFIASKKVCRQIKDGVGAIFGPMSAMSAAHVQSICDAMEIPHVETRWDFRENKDFFSINLYPHYTALSRSYIDLILYWKWTSFTILYETNEGLIRLQEILKAPSENEFQITVRKLESPDGDYRPILKTLRNSGVNRIIIDCDYRNVYEILRQAMTIRMMTQYYHYLLTTLDIDLVDLTDFKYDGTNITAFRLVDPTSPSVTSVTSDWIISESMGVKSPMNEERAIRTETALMYDAVYLFAKSLHALSLAVRVDTASLSCAKTRPWAHGSSMLNYMKMTKVPDGLTGEVKFDHNGRRTDFHLDLVELGVEGLEKVGSWNPYDGINVTKEYEQQQMEVAEELKNKTLVVTTILEKPYMMKKENYADRTGNDRFEGFCVDLLAEIALMLHFNYTIKLVDDDTYGSRDNNGEWGGMVRELMDTKADLAVASLTISYVREQVIDFTKPFMNLGISILFKRPEKKNPSLFSFLSPLSLEIWVYVVAAYLLVSFMLFVLARFSPYEWYNPHPCNQESDMVENQFTLLNSLWFTIGSLMQQGSEVAPRAQSTRIVSGIWWFFTLIIISSYTANLAAFLTVERMTSPIENADDLAKQTEIKYGTIWAGSTMTFFKTSKIPTYEKMWSFMSSAKESVFVNSTEEGIERVKKGGFAYLIESTMNEYFTQRNCDLMQVGGMLDSKGYGIGTPMGSKYRDLISDAILKLQEQQRLHELYDRWWKKHGGAGQCDNDDKGKKDANALAIANVGGIFVVLITGLGLSLIVAVLEFIWKAHKNADEGKHDTVYPGAMPPKSLCSEMARELRFALQCFGTSTKRKRNNMEPDHMDGNGMTMMPLTGYLPHNHQHSNVPSKDYYT